MLIIAAIQYVNNFNNFVNTTTFLQKYLNLNCIQLKFKLL